MKIYFPLSENKFSPVRNKSSIGRKQKIRADGTFILLGGKSRLVGTFPLVDQLADRFLHRHDAGCPPGIAACKGVAVFKVPFESVIQSGYDAIGAS